MGKRNQSRRERAVAEGTVLKCSSVNGTLIGGDELVIILPVKLVPGDPGDPFPDECTTLLRSMSNCGYWPVDFGEVVDTHWITLYFRKSSPIDAIKYTERFIQTGGDV